MKSPKPLLDEVFDQEDPADGQRFLRAIEELKVKAAADNVSHGILLHKWIDPTHIRVVVFEGTPAGKEAAEALLGQGFDEGPFLGAPSEPELSDVVAKARSATAHLKIPEGQAIPGPTAPSAGPGRPPGPAPSAGPRPGPVPGPGAASAGPQGTGRMAGYSGYGAPPAPAKGPGGPPGPGRTAPLQPRQGPPGAPSAPLGHSGQAGPMPPPGSSTGPQPPTGPLPPRPKKPPQP